MGKIIDLYQEGPIHIPSGNNVLVTGTYNLLMAHHVKQFKHVRSIADHVIVASNSAESMARYKPGNIQMPEQDRLEILTGIKYIDYATLFNTTDASDAIRILGSQGLINAWAKGADYNLDDLTEQEKSACDKYGIQIIFTPLFTDTMSTGNLIKQIKGR